MPVVCCEPNCDTRRGSPPHGITVGLQLSGTLPPCLSTMPWLSSLKVENNYRVRAPTPFSMYLVTDPMIAGHLLLEASGYICAVAHAHCVYDLAQLRGSIPAEFAAAPHLWWLDVGYNRFSGSVPASFMCADHLRCASVLGCCMAAVSA
jgi:hypothetical protein